VGFLRAPWLLPLRGEGFERHALGLFTAYDHRWRAGEERTDWLWGLARSREAAGYELDAVSWLWRAERTEAERRAHLLGIPLPRRPSGSADAGVGPPREARAARAGEGR
jgi:hypothetical protein